MTFQDIIDSLKEFDVLNADESWETSDLLLAGMAIQAFEKQVPKRPKHISKFKNYFPELENCLTGQCPECGQTIDDDMLFCFRCGQRLNWENLSKEKSDN